MSSRSLVLGFVGDLMLGRRVSAALATREAVSFWGDLPPLLQSIDAVFANLECPITESLTAWRGGRKAFRFRAHPRAIGILRAGNIGFVSLANNHILDYGADGLRDTLRHLRIAGIAHAGAGLDHLEASRPAILEIGGCKIGVISITDTMAQFAAAAGRPGTNYMRIDSERATLGPIAGAIRDLRGAGVALVVLSVHWGPNLRPWPPARFRRFARDVVDLGVDVFHGHSAHLVQGIELRAGSVIFYDTGNFLDDYWVFPFIRIDRSCLFLLSIVDGKIAELRLVPVRLQSGTVRRATGREARAILARILWLSRPFLDEAELSDGELRLSLHPSI